MAGAEGAPRGRIEVPTGVTDFPGERARSPRAWIEERYNLVHFTTQPRGGHFAAMEQPELFAADVADVLPHTCAELYRRISSRALSRMIRRWSSAEMPSSRREELLRLREAFGVRVVGTEQDPLDRIRARATRGRRRR